MHRALNGGSPLAGPPEEDRGRFAAGSVFPGLPEGEACMLYLAADSCDTLVPDIPPHPILLLEQLIERAERIDLEHGIRPAADAKLEAAMAAWDALEADDDIAAIHAMEEFQRIAQSQRGSLIPVRKMAGLARDAEEIILRLEAED